MAKADDCICRPDDDGGILYNPRCTFHKGPIAGYGYDSHGRPNDKYSQRVGTIGAIVVLVALALLAAWSVYKVLSIS